ncbi:MAG: hypothetical protein ABJQ29_06140 [Luteolibacter sp.]
MSPIPIKVCLLLVVCSLALPAQGASDAGDDKSKAGDATPGKDTSPSAAARAAFDKGDFEEAVKLALPLAEKGDVDAIFLLGVAHESGKGAELSAKKAEEYYRKGLAKNHSDSAYRLAVILMATKDEVKLKEAQAILEKQALNDPGNVGRILGEAFLAGRFTGKSDPDKAVLWWKKSADAGDVDSMLLLANFYDGQMGFAEKKDPALTLRYLEKAAAGGNTGAMVALGSRLLYGEKSGRDEARGRAILDKAIAAKDYSAYFVLGTWQETVKEDSKAALVEFERGKDAGQADCMIRVAEYHIEGKGTKKDVERGVSILEAAAEADNFQAHLMLAAMTFQSENPDIALGYKHLVAAANGGLAAAQNELGLFYLAGRLGVTDVSAAVSWFARAAEANYAAAQNNLAALHESGTGVPQSYENAAQLYVLAAQQGNASATLALARFQAAGAAMEMNLPRAWALAKLAGVRGESNAAEFITALEKGFTKEQLAEAKKEFERMTSGEAPE